MTTRLPDVSSYGAIKMRQRKELWFVGYYLIYFLDMCRGMYYTWAPNRARVFVRFEREAKDRAGTQQYLRYRKRFAWENYRH